MGHGDLGYLPWIHTTRYGLGNGLDHSPLSTEVLEGYCLQGLYQIYPSVDRPNHSYNIIVA